MKDLLNELVKFGISAKSENKNIKIKKSDLNKILYLAAKKPGYFLNEYTKTVKEKNKSRDEIIEKWEKTAAKIADGLITRLVDETLDILGNNLNKDEKSAVFSFQDGLRKNGVDSLIEYLEKNIAKSKYAPMLDDLKQNDVLLEELLDSSIRKVEFENKKNHFEKPDSKFSKHIYDLCSDLLIDEGFKVTKDKVNKENKEDKENKKSFTIIITWS